MRHFFPLYPLPVGMTMRAFSTPLVAPPNLPQRRQPGGLRAILVAVAVAAIAPPAQGEHLAARRPGANDEAKRVHVPSAGAAKNWTSARIRATKRLSTPRPRGSARGSEGELRALALFGTSDRLLYLELRGRSNFLPASATRSDFRGT
jgi:hypothetical protein